MPPEPLAVEKLCSRSDPAQYDFETTDEIPDVDGVFGQERAVNAISLAASIPHAGYNLFVLGTPGVGRHSTVRSLLANKAAKEPVPSDQAYVFNFETPHKPNALALPPGQGVRLRDAVARMIDDIRTAIPASFEGDEYRSRRQALDESFRERQEQAFEDLRERASAKNVALIRTPMGFALAPVRQGEVIKPEVFKAMPREETKEIEADIEELQKELQTIVEKIPLWEKEHRDAVRSLNKETTEYTISPLIQELRQQFSDFPEVLAHVDAMRKDLQDNVHLLLGLEGQAEGQIAALMPGAAGDQANTFGRYQVNLIVDNSDLANAPVVYADHPSMANLVGRVEYLSQMGALVTDFKLIKPGAMHRANGGYLIIDARRLLTEPLAYEALKRTIRAGEIYIESPGQMMSLINTVSLEPEPIPLSVKIALVGEPALYYLLAHYDPEFEELFKIAAEFEDVTERSKENSDMLVRFIASATRRDALKPFDRTAVARVMEHASRLAADSEKLSIHLEDIANLLKEANFFADSSGNKHVTAEHVQRALDEQVHRADRFRERLYEAIRRGVVLIDTRGEKVGQVNGLAVLQLNRFAFGHPSRITARVRLGGGRVVDIEREVELGGPLHSKGVMILSGFISARYVPDTPLSVSVTLVFEQTYGGVDGDSASAAELFAILSALSGVPIRQSYAVTGSVNQHGDVQAIGGVNEKIEGFFDICKSRGLDGDQGVLIPESNVPHLMLRDEVVEAVSNGKFHIYAIKTVDEGIEVLTGKSAGDRADDGRFPEGSINRLVEDRLVAMAEARKKFGAERQDGEDDQMSDGPGKA